MHPLILVALLQAHPTVCYEVFVRSFYDSNGDGIGDLRGLTQKLDYIAGLGVDCVWLMPVAESPSYHGYDVTNYYRVEPDYGTNDDFKAFVAAAHHRHVRVLVDLVLNHTSSDHPWFQEALKDSTSPIGVGIAGLPQRATIGTSPRCGTSTISGCSGAACPISTTRIPRSWRR